MIRLQKWQVDEKRRQVSDLQDMLAQFERRAEELEAEVRREQKAASLDLAVSYIYGPYAESVLQRRATLRESIVEVESSIEVARDELADLYQELKRYELALEQRQRRQDDKRRRREENELDEIGLNGHRRKTAAR